MRNLTGSNLDAQYTHHRSRYCSYARQYWRNIIQYLRDIEKVILSIKKDR